MGIVDQKKIAMNTLFLYLRMGVIMVIGLFTSRIVLAALGEVDFGLYGAVGGIVVAFSFLNGVMSAACNRYFAIELGRGDYGALKKVFSLNVTIFIALGAVILILAETVGVWFLNAKMVFPPERAAAVGWVYQISVISFILTMISTPYRAMIIAKEKMKVFAYCSVIEAVLKFSTALLIASAPFDRLVFYACGMAAVSVMASLFYVLYCTRFYGECRFRFVWDVRQVKEIMGFTGWNVIGNLSGIGRSQGINILLNMFFGPVVNAARGVAYQVYMTISQFVTNFTMAFNPQITKAYAAEEKRAMMKLVLQASKFSYLLLFTLMMPVIFETPLLLDVWLKDVPDGAVAMTRVMLATALLDALGNPLATAMQATGRIKWYQIFVGGSLLLSVPLAYLCLKLKLTSPLGVLWIVFGMSVIAQAARIVFVRRAHGLTLREYAAGVLMPVLAVSVISFALTLVLKAFTGGTLRGSIAVLAVSVLVPAALSFAIGMTSSEREWVMKYIRKKR